MGTVAYWPQKYRKNVEKSLCTALANNHCLTHSKAAEPRKASFQFAVNWAAHNPGEISQKVLESLQGDLPCDLAMALHKSAYPSNTDRS